MRGAALATALALLAVSCGTDPVTEPESSSGTAQVVASGLNYPSTVAYMPAANAGLAAGSVLVGQAGGQGAGSNSVIAIAPDGAVTTVANSGTLATGGRVAVTRPTALDSQGPWIGLANFADGVGSVAFLGFGGTVASEVIRNGLLDARDFGFTVTEVRPASGSVINELRPTIQVFLSQPVDPSTVTSVRFFLDRVGSSLDPDSTFGIAPDGRSMTLTPDGGLIPGISYEVNLSTAIRDIRGTGLDADPFTPSRQAFESAFRISGQAPVLRVASVSPRDGEQDVPLNARVMVVFSLAVNPATVTGQSFFISNPGGNNVPGSISVSGDGGTATFTPSNTYPVDTQLRVNVTTDIQDTAGNQLDADPGGDPTPFFSTFRTAGGADTTPPRVTAVDPANNGTAPPSSSVTVTFSEAIDPTSITGNSFRLEQGGNRVGASVSAGSSATEAVLDPTDDLMDGQTYTVIVTTDVRDRSGNALSPAFQSTFTVRGSSVVINEVVTDPQRDWNDSVGGNGIPFDNVPGTGDRTDSDEWVELFNASGRAVSIAGWTLEMRDSTSATHVVGSTSGTTFEVYSSGSSASNFRGGAFLVIGNPGGEINNDVYLALRDSANTIIDDVEIGDDLEGDGPGDGAPDPGVDGNASGAGDEAVVRTPNGRDTNNDIRDFDKRQATIGGTTSNQVLVGPSLPGIDGGATGVAYAGTAPDEAGPNNQLYFLASSNSESIIAADLDDDVYTISQFFNPRGVVFVPGGSIGTGELYVLHASSSTGGSGVTRMRIRPNGPIGSAGTRVEVSTDPGAILSLASGQFNEPVSLTMDPETDLLYVPNRGDSTILELDFSAQPRILRSFRTDVPPDRLTSAVFGRRGGVPGLYLTDDGGDGIGGGSGGRLLFFPLP